MVTEPVQCPKCGGEGTSSFWSTKNPAVRVRARCKKCGGFGKLFTVQWLDGTIERFPKTEPLTVSIMDEERGRGVNFYRVESWVMTGLGLTVISVLCSLIVWYSYQSFRNIGWLP